MKSKENLVLVIVYILMFGLSILIGLVGNIFLMYLTSNTGLCYILPYDSILVPLCHSIGMLFIIVLISGSALFCLKKNIRKKIFPYFAVIVAGLFLGAFYMLSVIAQQ